MSDFAITPAQAQRFVKALIQKAQVGELTPDQLADSIVAVISGDESLAAHLADTSNAHPASAIGAHGVMELESGDWGDGNELGGQPTKKLALAEGEMIRWLGEDGVHASMGFTKIGSYFYLAWGGGATPNGAGAQNEAFMSIHEDTGLTSYKYLVQGRSGFEAGGNGYQFTNLTGAYIANVGDAKIGVGAQVPYEFDAPEVQLVETGNAADFTTSNFHKGFKLGTKQVVRWEKGAETYGIYITKAEDGKLYIGKADGDDDAAGAAWLVSIDPASQQVAVNGTIAFDNTGTDIVATTVEGALAELALRMPA